MAKTLTVYCIIVCKMCCVCQAHLTIGIGSVGVCYQLLLIWRRLIHKVVNGMIKFCLDYRGCRKLVFAKHVLLMTAVCSESTALTTRIAIFRHLTGPRIACCAGTVIIALVTQLRSSNATLRPKLSVCSLWHALCAPRGTK